MSFPGRFTEHFLPEHMSRVSLSFLVDSMDKRRGGCAPNIAYTLALLGEKPRLMATAGQDFEDYRRWLEAAGVDTSLVREVPGKFTASFFCSTDTESNQIASFTGPWRMLPSNRSDGPCDLAIIAQRAGAMVKYATSAAPGHPPHLRPGRHCARRRRRAEGRHRRRDPVATTTSSRSSGRRRGWRRPACSITPRRSW
jgi:adenosine kinase